MSGHDPVPSPVIGVSETAVSCRRYTPVPGKLPAFRIINQAQTVYKYGFTISKKLIIK